MKIKEYIKKYATDPELIVRAAKQLEENQPEEKKEDGIKDNGSELSETSLKSDEEAGKE